MVRCIALLQRKSRSHFAVGVMMIALLSACASNTEPLRLETLSDEYLHWGDVDDSELECIGEALCGSHPRVMNLLKVARIPFRGTVELHQTLWVFIAVPKSRANEARAYLERYAKGPEFSYRPFPRT